MNEIITTALVSFISTIVGYLVGNRKTQAETDAIVLENVKTIIGVYAETINDLKSEVKELKEKIMEYEKMIDEMSLELSKLRKQLQDK